MDMQVLTHSPSVLTSPDRLHKIYRLQEKNISTYLPLPQFVAVGDRSSGKSSPVDDIERQLQGIEFAKPAAVDTSSRPQLPAQKRLVEALTAPLSDTLEGQFRRRDNTINAVSAYCVVEEGQTVRRTNTSSAYPSERAVIGEPPAESLCI
ncbi:hypothetical protein BKA56DRAFT_604059 [Ilyonectria sp. MPI-CAGE-AT-0026]|nr:hypothetical protein BKA56DRAFT_604059 [Ilyonectria sp. MPI-CAGE-AT-0026]